MYILWESLLIGVIQGLSEFFPISSSGHLSLLQIFFSSDQWMTLIVVAHFGSFFSLILFYRSEIKYTFKNLLSPAKDNLFIKLWLGSLPTILIGFLYYHFLKQSFYQLSIVVMGFFFTSIFLLGTYYIKPNQTSKKIHQISYWQALGVGLFQSLALLPGVSRSGVSIAGGMYLGMPPSIALPFSFLLGSISLCGAFALEFSKIQWSSSLLIPFSIILVSSFVSGYLALYFMRAWCHKLYQFGFYLLSLGWITSIYLFYTHSS